MAKRDIVKEWAATRKMEADAPVRAFASMAEFVRAISEVGDRPNVKGDGRSHDKWAGGSWEDAVRYAREGDLSQVEAAERLVDRLDREIDTDGVRPMWMPSVVGALPLVPAYLAGTPEAMLARTDVPDARGDMEIWANTTVSNNCSSRDMVRRGVVTLAFAMALSRVRNVRLVIYSTCEAASVAIRLASPIDYSEVCAAFCQPSITRKLFYGWAVAFKKNPYATLRWASWAEAVTYSDNTERKALIERAGMPENAILLTTERLGSYASVPDDMLVSILNEKVREYCGA